MQRVLEKIDDPKLEVLVVWIPAIRGDSYEASLQSRSLISDSRARHYWDGSQALGNAVATEIETNMNMAWDVYLAFDGTAKWGATPPKPVEWLHQKGTEDPDRRMDEASLEALLRQVLE